MTYQSSRKIRLRWQCKKTDGEGLKVKQQHSYTKNLSSHQVVTYQLLSKLTPDFDSSSCFLPMSQQIDQRLTHNKVILLIQLFQSMTPVLSQFT